MPRLKGISLGTDVAGQIRQGVTPQVSPVGRATAQLGRSIVGLGADITKREEQTEISGLTAQMAAYHAEQTNRWSETLRTGAPGDTKLSQNFMKTFQDGLTKIGEGASTRGGQSYFTRSSAQMSGQFLKTTFAGQAHLAGVKSVQDYTSAQSNRSSVLIKEPSDYDFVIQQHNEQIDQLIIGGGLSTEQGLELKTRGTLDLTKQAIRGWGRNDVNDARRRLTAGEWDKRGITGDVKKQMFGELNAIETAQRVEAGRIKAAEAEALKEKRIGINNQFFDDMHEKGLSTQTVLDSELAPFGSGSKDQWIKMIDIQARKAFELDPALQSDLLDRINLPDDDPDKITDERDLNEHFAGLGQSAFNFLRGEVQGNKTIEGKLANQNRKVITNAAKGDITGSNRALGFVDPIGNEIYARYLIDVNKQFLEGRREGVSIADLTQNESSPHFLGKVARKYRRSLEQRLQTTINMLDPAPLVAEGEPIPIPSDQVKTPQIRQGQSVKDFFKQNPDMLKQMMEESLE